MICWQMCRTGRRVSDRLLRFLGGILLPLVLTGCAGLSQQAGPATTGEAVASPSERLLGQARESHRKGQLNEALSFYERVLDGQPDHVEANVGAGEVLLDMRQPGPALERFERVLKRSPDSVAALEGRGYALLGLRRLNEAGVALKRVVGLNPARWRAWSGLGILADLRRDGASAQGYYQKALLVLPDHPLLLNNRAFSLMMLGHYAEAEELLRKALEHDPDDMRILNNLAWCLAAQKRYDDALKMLSRHFQPAMASNNIGYIAMLQGDYPAAVRYFKQALELSPVFYERAANNLAEAKRRMRRSADR